MGFFWHNKEKAVSGDQGGADQHVRSDRCAGLEKTPGRDGETQHRKIAAGGNPHRGARCGSRF